MKDVLMNKFSDFLDDWIHSSTRGALFLSAIFLHVIILFENDVAEWLAQLLEWNNLQYHMKILSAVGFDFFLLEYLANILWKIKNEIIHINRMYGTFEYGDYLQKEQRRCYFLAGIPSIMLSVFSLTFLQMVN